jgi:hypothetical protein
MKNLILAALFLLCVNVNFAQSEVLTNVEIIEMTKAGLSTAIIVEKIKSSVGRFTTTAKDLIELKKADVADEVIKVILEKDKLSRENVLRESVRAQTVSEAENFSNQKTVFSPAEALRNARTVSLRKNSLHPSLPALEKELLKRPEWKELKLTITADESNPDLYIQINFVHLSLITHRYTFRIYDTRSGTVVAAGETTSWGSLAGNLAKKIIKSLVELK